MAGCKWSRDDLFLDIVLGNTSDVPVEVPVEFIRRRGPAVLLRDARSGADLQIPTNPPPGDLRERRTTLAPGGSATIEWVLHASELTHFGRPVDVTAQITLFGDMLVEGEKTPFEVTTSLPIRE